MFARLKISSKLLVGVLLMLVVSGLIAGIGHYGLQRINTEVSSMYEDRLIPVADLVGLKADLMEVRATIMAMITEPSEAKQKLAEQKIQQASQRVDETLDRYLQAANLGQVEKEKLQALKIVWGEFRETRDKKIIPFIYAGEIDGALALANGVQSQRFGMITTGSNELIDMFKEHALAGRMAAEQTVSSSMVYLWSISGCGILISAALNYFIARSITIPLSNVAELVQGIASGDLSKQVDVHSKDEVGQMAAALNATVAGIRTALDMDHVDWKLVGEQREKNNDFAGQIAAIGKSQAVIAFDMDGTIRDANDNFLKTLGYTLDEVKGRHHSLFIEEAFRSSAEYKEFWARLNRGEYQASEYKRIGKGGKEVFIQASYNPILDLQGKPFKVVKYASDITSQVHAREDLKGKVDSMLQVVGAATTGDLTQEITVRGEDSIGQMGKGLAHFFEDLRTSITTITSNALSLGSSAEELSAVSVQMSSNAEQASSQVNVVAAAAEEVSANVKTVSTGVEELGASIREIATSANQSAKVTQQAVEFAKATNAKVAKLGESSAEIDNVIKVITSIAEQTNLLALNATIEAARAGGAGKGFAVVANEVKELAKETAKATEDIRQKIETIQSDTRGAVDAIERISEIIGEVNDLSNTIASAVEEQTATANEINRNVLEAAKGTGEIAQNISSVAQTAQSTSQGAGNVQAASSELARMAAGLQELVSRFKCEASAEPVSKPSARAAGSSKSFSRKTEKFRHLGA